MSRSSLLCPGFSRTARSRWTNEQPAERSCDPPPGAKLVVEIQSVLTARTGTSHKASHKATGCPLCVNPGLADRAPQCPVKVGSCSHMRPRSRLLAKKRLPTIREGPEEPPQDRACLSSEDYLLSIRELARPAFPLREQDRDVPPPCRPPTPAPAVATATPDPLEYLYGCRDGPASSREQRGGARPGSRPLPRSHSFPRLCLPRHAPRKGSCPEIRLADAPGPAPSGGSPQKKPGEAEPGETRGGGAPAGERKNCSGPADTHSLISSWISDCRSAWHEARSRACMLPTIAEI
ncbi:hypothetical protein COCON_G00040900 [Conger conger]|uniref:Uncharacterized protein n=1 Tax=Conger conger TaxID=82655 RepID=A0A9Q1DTM1_CONCO|nr:hypothetical protein COCON_G00040900 [Conger conger]